jgi:hypothetical protein
MIGYMPQIGDIYKYVTHPDRPTGSVVRNYPIVEIEWNDVNLLPKSMTFPIEKFTTTGDFELVEKWLPIGNSMVSQIKCECGAQATGLNSNLHSSWCPVFR